MSESKRGLVYKYIKYNIHRKYIQKERRIDIHIIPTSMGWVHEALCQLATTAACKGKVGTGVDDTGSRGVEEEEEDGEGSKVQRDA